jgi:hypothetical protein
MNAKYHVLVAATLVVTGTSPCRAGEESGTTGSADAALMKCEKGHCVISTLNPHAAAQPHAPKAEAPDVLKTLEQIVKAYSSGDLETYQSLLDNECTYFDQDNHKMIVGKPQVIEHLKASFAKHAPSGAQPLLSYTIDQPYVKVSGKMAVVTYRAFEEIGGAKPLKAHGLISKVFIKDGNGWKQQHDSSWWQEDAPSGNAGQPQKSESQ